MKTVILTEDQAVRPFSYQMIVGEQLPITVLMKYPPDSAEWGIGDGLELISQSIIGREVSALIKAKMPSELGYTVNQTTEVVCTTYTTAHSDPHHAESYQRKFIVKILLASEAQ